MTTDTLIIGGGAAGLAAAADLHKAGRAFVVLEARLRIGGRVHTLHDPLWPAPLELGAEFIHGRPEESWEVVRRAGLSAYDVANLHWLSKKGRPRKGSAEWPAVERIMARLKRVGEKDMAFDQFLMRHASSFSAPARRLARAFVEGLDAVDAGQVSALSLRNSEADGATFDADTPFRLVEGYGRFIEALAEGLPENSIQLGAVVRALRWSRGRVEAQLAGGEALRAQRVIVTLPIGVLRAGAEDGGVRFDPPLPAGHTRAIEMMRMGAVVKLLLRFDSAFWEKSAWRGLSFVHAPGSAFPTWWTSLPMRLPLLTAWAGGPGAEALSHLRPAEVLGVALKSLAQILGQRPAALRRRLTAWHVADWQADPFSRGAYAFATVGGALAPRTLARPVEKTLFFAGEAAHSGYSGTVAAAIASGRRAARQVLAVR